jgi:Tfp pilus assembly protein PilZ
MEGGMGHGLNHQTIDALSLPELVERLEDLEGRRTPVGWSPEDAVVRAAVERRILEVVRTERTDQGRTSDRISCALSVRIRTKRHAFDGTVCDLGLGGAFVATAAEFPVGTHVYLESDEDAGVRVRGQVAWLDDAGLGISFSDQPSDAHERRLRRFVVELLRHHASTTN